MMRLRFVDPPQRFATHLATLSARGRFLATNITRVDLLRNTAAHTRAARLAHIDELLFKEKGNPEWNARTMFSKDALDFFARVVKLYASLGWPMDRGRAPRRPRAWAKSAAAAREVANRSSSGRRSLR